MRVLNSGVLLFFALLAAASGGALAQELRISHQWTAGVDGRDRAARLFAQEAESRTTGLKFRIYPSSSLNIKPPDLLDALQKNSLEMAVYPLTYAVATVPEFSLAGLPGLVPNLQAARALKDTEIYTTLQSIAEANGIRIVTWWWSPGHSSRRAAEYPIRSRSRASECAPPTPYSSEC